MYLELQKTMGLWAKINGRSLKEGCLKVWKLPIVTPTLHEPCEDPTRNPVKLYPHQPRQPPAQGPNTFDPKSQNLNPRDPLRPKKPKPKPSEPEASIPNPKVLGPKRTAIAAGPTSSLLEQNAHNLVGSRIRIGFWGMVYYSSSQKVGTSLSSCP